MSRKMYDYKLFGLKVTSDLEFHQLAVCQEPMETDFLIRVGETPQWILEKEQAGIRYEFGDKISWLANKTCYLLVEDGKKLTYQRKEGANPDYLRTYILGWGMSMLAMQRGVISMHCSAVADEKGAILIAGESGSGKSTLTSALLAKGYRLMADDMAWVENTSHGVMVSPAFPYQKLCRDAAVAQGYRLEELYYIDEEKDKFLVHYRGEFSSDSVPVKGFIMLGITGKDEVVCQEAEGLLKFQMIANNQFLRVLLGADRYQPALGQKCLEIAAGIPMYYLLRPMGRDTIQEIIKKAFGIAEDFDHKMQS